MWHTRDLLHVFDRSLRSLLDGEMEHSAGLRQETDLLKRKLAELEERHTAKVQALARWDTAGMSVDINIVISASDMEDKSCQDS